MDHNLFAACSLRTRRPRLAASRRRVGAAAGVEVRTHSDENPAVVGPVKGPRPIYTPPGTLPSIAGNRSCRPLAE